MVKELKEGELQQKTLKKEKCSLPTINHPYFKRMKRFIRLKREIEGVIMKITLLLITLISLGTAQTASDLNKQGEALYAQGKKAEAHELFLRAYEQDSSSAKIMGNLSVSSLGRGEYDRAVYWGERLLKNTGNSTLIANGNYNIAKAYEKQEQFEQARSHFRSAYSANPRSVYLRSIDKINAKVDTLFIDWYEPEHEMESAETRSVALSDQGYGEPTKLHEILGIDRSRAVPEFIDTYMLSENGTAEKIDITNDGVDDIYFNSIMGTGRFTNYYIITKGESGEWKLLKETAGGNCCYEEPSFLTLQGLNYFVGPDRVIRYDGERVAFHYGITPDTTERVVHVEEVQNGALFRKVIPTPSSLKLERHYGPDTLRVDLDGNGSTEIIVRNGESCGGMGQWFRYEVTVNGSSLWSEDDAGELLRTEVRTAAGRSYLVNIYDGGSCKLFLYGNGRPTLQAAVELSEEFSIRYIWENKLK